MLTLLQPLCLGQTELRFCALRLHQERCFKLIFGIFGIFEAEVDLAEQQPRGCATGGRALCGWASNGTAITPPAKSTHARFLRFICFLPMPAPRLRLSPMAKRFFELSTNVRQ